MPVPFLRVIQKTSKPGARGIQLATSSSYSLQISCHVKPNSSSKREGITAVREEAIDVAVAAAPRDGEANRAVERVLALIFCVPKSNVKVIRGLKTREKMLSIGDIPIGNKGEAEFLHGVRQRLEKAVMKS